MKINSIHIVGFGKLKDYTLSFNDGMNIIYGENEAGKSTIMAFIEMMFYGKVANEKSTDVSKSARKKYTPWDGTMMGGELEFTHDNKNYRIQKTFKKTIRTDEVKLFDADTGMEIMLGKDEEIGSRFFGIDVSSFEKSIYISGFGGFADKGDTSEDIAVKLSNMVTTLDEDVSGTEIVGRITIAMEALRSRRGDKGIIPELEEEEMRLKAELLQTKDVMNAQVEYNGRRSALEANMLRYEQKKELISRNNRAKSLVEQRDKVSIKRRELAQLNEEYQNINKKRFNFVGEQYNYESAPSFIEDARRLKSFIDSEKQNVEAAAGKLDNTAVIVALEDVNKVTELERKKGNYELINTYITTTYANAVHDKDEAENSMNQTKKALDVLENENKSKLTLLSIIALVLAVLCAVMGIIVSPFAYVGAGILLVGGIGILVSDQKKKKNTLNQIRDLSDKYKDIQRANIDAATRLKKDIDTIRRLGEGIFPGDDCDFAAINNRVNVECIKELNAIYEKYGVESSKELNILSGKSDKARDAKLQYDNAVNTLKKREEQYKEYVNGVDIDEVAHNYETIRNLERTFVGKLSMLGMKKDNFAADVDDELAKFDEEIVKINDELTDINNQITKLGGVATDEIGAVTTDEIGADNLTIQECDEKIKDINNQLLDIASLLKVPEHEPENLEREIADTQQELKEKKRLHELLNLAKTNISAAMEDISRSFGPMLNDKTADIFAKLTGGIYKNVMVDREYALQVKKDTGMYRDFKYLSNGTTDQAYLALRLAMTDLITEGGEKLPVMLDDVLLQYDDKRTGYALDYLNEYAKESQLILFTCKKAWIKDCNCNVIEL